MTQSFIGPDPLVNVKKVLDGTVFVCPDELFIINYLPCRKEIDTILYLNLDPLHREGSDTGRELHEV